jgi:beta-mannosidase
VRVLLDRSPWRVRGFLGDEWQHHRVWTGGPLREPDAWLPARVPGSVVDDLWHSGAVPDPYAGLNTRAIEWVADRHWVYRHEFTLRPPQPDQCAWLCLDGVDHSGKVYLDGRELGRVEGMFVPARFDVTEVLRSGPDHLLVVVVEPAPVSEPQVGYTSAVGVHKARMTYGWDFCPRLVHQGIWQQVYVEMTGPARIADIAVSTDIMDCRAEVRVQTDIDAEGNSSIELTLADADGQVVAAGTGMLTVENPRLWWPNGHGDPYLYRLTVTALCDGKVSDVRELDVGLRSLRFYRAEGAPDSAQPYGVEVNGRRILAKGWNWVPMDLSYGVTRPERLDHLLDLAADAGVTVLRVWGGGLIETPAFYDGCDRRGLLVWQEFSQSSSGIESTPSDKPAFLAMMHDQAEQIVPRLRHHPSLAVWGGGNELQAGEGEPLDDSTPVLGVLAEVVRRLDPERLWLPTSPTGPAFLNRLDLIEQAPADQHDVHGPWEHQGLQDHYALYDAGTAHLLSEFGVEGMTSPRVLGRVVPEPDRRLPTGGRPVWNHLGRWWNNEDLVQACFGGRITDLATLGLASQFLQRDGLSYAVEAHRRRAPGCVGTLPWQFNEPYPNAWCTAAVTHAGEPKPAYFGVAAAYRPVLVGAICSAQSWVGTTELRLPLWALAEVPLEPASITARLVSFDGDELAALTVKDLDLGAGTVMAGELRATTPDGPFVVDVRLTAGAVQASRRYVLTGSADLGSLLDGQASLDASYATGRLTVRHLSGPVAPFVRVLDGRPYRGGDADADGWMRCSDSGFVVLPGEEREIDINWRQATGDLLVGIDGLGLGHDGRVVRVAVPGGLGT